MLVGDLAACEWLKSAIMYSVDLCTVRLRKRVCYLLCRQPARPRTLHNYNALRNCISTSGA
jgi:hypothetical protein